MRRSTHLGVMLACAVLSGCDKKPAETVSVPTAGEPAAPQPPAAAPATAAGDTKNLKAIGLALYDHHDVFNRFPAAATVEAKTGKRLLSWRVAILPHLDQKALSARFKLDEPWDSDHNKKLIAEMPSVYATPGTARAEGLTYYRVFIGKVPHWDWSKHRSMIEILDGISVAGAVFVTTRGVPWTQPDEPDADPKANPVEALRFTDGKSPVLYYDGSVRLLERATLVTALTAGWTEAARANLPVNTFKYPTAYLSDPDSLTKLPPEPSVTVDGVVVVWPDVKPAPGQAARHIRLASLKKVPGGPDKPYRIDCTLPDGSREFEGVRLQHVVKVRGGVAQWANRKDGSVEVVLRDCKLVSVANGTVPPTPSALEAAKTLQGQWRATGREGSDLTMAYLGRFDIRVTDLCMTWTIATNKTSNAVTTFGLELEPGGVRGAVNLHPLALHMVPALYEVQGDTLRLALQFPLDAFREDTQRPAKLLPSRGVNVIVAERVK